MTDLISPGAMRIGDLTFNVHDHATMNVRLHVITCDQRRSWRYVAKTSEEVQAFLRGVALGQTGEF